jgi:hypothetical protein
MERIEESPKKKTEHLIERFICQEKVCHNKADAHVFEIAHEPFS